MRGDGEEDGILEEELVIGNTRIRVHRKNSENEEVERTILLENFREFLEKVWVDKEWTKER